MIELVVLPPAAKFIKKLKDKKLKQLYREAIDEIVQLVKIKLEIWPV